MKKTLLMSLLCAALVCAFGLASVNAADAPADGLKMEKTKNPVTFNHSTHKTDCKDCHHKWDGAAAVKKCSDAGCHDNFDKKDKSDASYYKAMHGKGKTVSSCVSCHKAESKKMDKAAKKAMTGCKKSKCHP